MAERRPNFGDFGALDRSGASSTEEARLETLKKEADTLVLNIQEGKNVSENDIKTFLQKFDTLKSQVNARYKTVTDGGFDFRPDLSRSDIQKYREIISKIDAARKEAKGKLDNAQANDGYTQALEILRSYGFMGGQNHSNNVLSEEQIRATIKSVMSVSNTSGGSKGGALLRIRNAAEVIASYGGLLDFRKKGENFNPNYRTEAQRIIKVIKEEESGNTRTVQGSRSFTGKVNAESVDDKYMSVMNHYRIAPSMLEFDINNPDSVPSPQEMRVGGEGLGKALAAAGERYYAWRTEGMNAFRNRIGYDEQRAPTWREWVGTLDLSPSERQDFERLSRALDSSENDYNRLRLLVNKGGGASQEFWDSAGRAYYGEKPYWEDPAKQALWDQYIEKHGKEQSYNDAIEDAEQAGRDAGALFPPASSGPDSNPNEEDGDQSDARIKNALHGGLMRALVNGTDLKSRSGWHG